MVELKLMDKAAIFTGSLAGVIELTKRSAEGPYDLHSFSRGFMDAAVLPYHALESVVNHVGLKVGEAALEMPQILDGGSGMFGLDVDATYGIGFALALYAWKRLVD